jgi:TetR/AcrR family transcriptional regulator
MMEKRDTRTMILSAAEEVFARKGFEKATVDEIAANAKIAKGTVFYNFKSKDDVFFAIIEKGTQNFFDRVDIYSAAGKTAADKLERAYDAAFEFFQENNDFCILLISEITRIRSRWNNEDSHLLDRFKQRLEALYVEGQAKGEFRRDLDSKDIGLLVFFLTAVSSISSYLTAEVDPERKLYERWKSIFLKGIEIK